jgi:hypothetical protein
MGESIRSRLDKATAHSEMYASRLDNQMDEMLGKAELDMQLEERKRRLGLSQPAETPTIEEEETEEEEVSWADLQ